MSHGMGFQVELDTLPLARSFYNPQVARPEQRTFEDSARAARTFGEA